MANSDSFQRRADAGGEIGPNGEFYKGGQFIANSEDTVKGGSMRWESRPKSEAELAREAEIAARVAAHAEWLAARAEEFAPLLAVLESEPQGYFETFWQSLARQLRQTGSLSPKQAHHAAKALYGRCTRKNEEDFLGLVERLREEFSV